MHRYDVGDGGDDDDGDDDDDDDNGDDDNQLIYTETGQQKLWDFLRS